MLLVLEFLINEQHYSTVCIQGLARVRCCDVAEMLSADFTRLGHPADQLLVNLPDNRALRGNGPCTKPY